MNATDTLSSRAHQCPRVGITLSWTDLSILTDGLSFFSASLDPSETQRGASSLRVSDLFHQF